MQITGTALDLEATRHNAFLLQAAINTSERMADQMRSRPASKSARLMNISSLRRFISAMERPLSFAMLIICAAFLKGNGTE